MAERKGKPSEYSKNNVEKDDENRESAENAPNAPPSRDNSEHKSAQTDTTEVRHVGIQFEPHPPRDEEETQRRTSNQNHQSQMNNFSVTDNQLAAGCPVLKNEGPTQLGEGNSMVNNPTYHITNHNHYHIHCQPSSHHGNNQPCHIPCQCQECIQSYVNQHMPLTDHPRHHPESESQHLGLPHHPVPQLLPSPQQTEQMESTERRGNNTYRPDTQQVNHSQQTASTESRSNGTSRSERGHVNNPQQTASKESRGNDQRKRPTDDQRPTPYRRLLLSDVIQHAIRTEREPAESETVNLEGGDIKKIIQSQPSQNAGTRPPSVSVTYDTVSIIDSKGQVLEPGDALWTKGPGYLTTAIYVGEQMLVRCEWETFCQMVKKEQLRMTTPFGKCRVIREGKCLVYPPRERVDRATAKIGKRWREGDRRGLYNFPTWVYTGLKGFEAKRQGFRLEY